MDTLLLVARIALAVVFVLASGTKLLDRAGTREAFEGFGVPRAFAAPGAVLLPWVELGTAVLLAVPATSWWGGLLALVLLAAFTVAISVNLGRGRAPACRCFGQFTPSPVSTRTILRNVLLSLPAILVVIAG